MSADLEELVNKTRGKEERILCPTCSIKTIHRVLFSFREISTIDPFYWDMNYEIIRCQGCTSVSFRQEDMADFDVDFDEEGNIYQIPREDLYPPRTEGRKKLADVMYLPKKIRKVYEETIKALNSQLHVLTGIGIRSLIEAVCKEKQSSGGNLEERINDLHNKGLLTLANSAFLHKLRFLGNNSTHEAKSHSDIQLNMAIDVVEHLLQEVYILPKRMEVELQDEKEKTRKT